jgi:hypothetical protein
LLALETLGASILVDTYEYIANEGIDWLMAFAVTCVVVVVWVLPNVAILYKARGLFAAKEKPGL